MKILAYRVCLASLISVSLLLVLIQELFLFLKGPNSPGLQIVDLNEPKQGPILSNRKAWAKKKCVKILICGFQELPVTSSVPGTSSGLNPKSQPFVPSSQKCNNIQIVDSGN